MKNSLGWLYGCSLFLFAVLMPVSLWADGTGVIKPFPVTGAFQATFREDVGSISVIEFAGNYNKDVANQFNAEPRSVVAREFLRTHADNYDFIVVFTGFEFNSGFSRAFHVGIQNQVKGIGLELAGDPAAFGSGGRLQGYIDMAALSRYVTDPLDARFDEVLETLGHEVLHQWSGRVRFDQGIGPESGLLGRDDSHWSDLLDSNGSVLYGHKWRNNGDGSFTSLAARKFFSPLDLYLAGLYRPSEVPPMTLIINPALNPKLTPSESHNINGPLVSGAVRTISIDDIIAAEGPRVPAFEQAQKHFRMAFVLLLGQNDPGSAQQLAGIDRVRRAFTDRFSIWTGGRATVEVFPEGLPETEAGVPVEIGGGDVRTDPASLAAGFAWLRDQQTEDGFWQDKTTTLLRDSSVSLDVLSRLDTKFVRGQQGLDWLLAQSSSNTDYLARQALVFAKMGKQSEATELRESLRQRQNDDGGWGINPGFDSNPLDTALVVAALTEEVSVGQAAIAKAVDYLSAGQNPDGGWSYIRAGASRTGVTATVLRLLKQLNQQADVETAAVNFLVVKQNSDGGFGDSPSSAHDTSNVLLAMLDVNALPQIKSEDAAEYLYAQQDIEGSWGGSTYATAVTLEALQKFNFPNWSFASGISYEPNAPIDGDRLKLSLTVRNDASLDTPVGVLRLFDGDPAAAGLQIGSDIAIPALAAGSGVTLSRYWDTLNLTGEHKIFALIDPDNNQVEMSERDNLAVVNINIAEAPAGVDLSITNADIAVMPAKPNRLPADLGFAVTLRNLGNTNAENVLVQLRRGSLSGELLDQQQFSIAGRASIAANFTYQLTTVGAQDFYVHIDPQNSISEVNETNNSAKVTVSTENSLDLAVAVSDISSDKAAPLVGEDVSFKVKLHNYGTLEAPSSLVRYSISDGNNTTEIQASPVIIPAGQFIEQIIVWRVDREAALTFTVLLDGDNLLPEIDESNNSASFNFTSGQATGPNLRIDYNDFSFQPNPGLEGHELTLSAVVRNTGSVAAANVEVAFYNGDPNKTGKLIGYADPIVSLASGTSINVSFVWPKVPDANDKLLYVVLDPNNAIAEFSEADNQAFNTLEILNLADLAISRDDISFTPLFPRESETINLKARISNLGQQVVADVVVRFFAGDPDAGAAQIGVDQLVTLEGHSASIVTTSFTLPTAVESAEVFVLLDPENTLLESSKLNNRASRAVAVQNSDFYVSQRYISPNGDGVQDDSEFFFRLKNAADVEIAVLNWRGEEVRRFDSANLNNITAGSVVWDGLDNLGRLVLDGRYTLQVHANQQIVGTAFLELDLNRSPLLQALNTPYESFSNWSCELNRFENFTLLNDETTAVFSIPRVFSSAEVYATGIYRMQMGGVDISALVPGSLFEQKNLTVPSYNRLLVTPDDETVVFWARHKSQPWIRSFWLVDSDGKNLREHPRAVGTNSMGFTADSSAIVIENSGKVIAEPLNGETPIQLVDFNDYRASSEGLGVRNHRMSPDGLRLFVDLRDYDNSDRLLMHANLETGEITAVVESDTATTGYQADYWKPTWSTDGSKLLIADQNNNEFRLYDKDAKFISSINWPQIDSVIAERSLSQLLWSSRNDEFAFMLYAGDVAAAGHLPSESPSELGGIYIANLVTGKVEQVHAFTRHPSVQHGFFGPSPYINGFHWAPNERTLIYDSRSTRANKDETVWAFYLDEKTPVEQVFAEFGNKKHGFDASYFSSTGRALSFLSTKLSADQSNACSGGYNGYSDRWSFRSLLNLTADLRAVRSQRVGGILLSGTVADKNFDRYLLEYASTTSPGVWQPVQPASGQSVIDEQFTVWIPPQAGSYLVRLSSYDLAGNVRKTIRRVSWGETPSITDIYREPALFSPNADGVRDVSIVQYRVLQPVHLDFNFYNQQGDLVRSISRDHASVGSSFGFAWDGRDNNGLLLADGRYRMTVQDYEFFFSLDATAPVVKVELLDAYQKYSKTASPQGPFFVRVSPEIKWSINDERYLDSVVQKISALNQNNIVDFFDLDPREKGKGELNSKLLEVSQVADSLYRIVAEDKAGNRTISPSAAVKQQLIISTIGTHQLENGSDINNKVYLPLGPVAYAEMTSTNGSEPKSSVKQHAVRFLVHETIASKLTGVSLQFRPLAQSAWKTSVFSSFLTTDKVPKEITSAHYLFNNAFQAVWLPADVNQHEDFVVRIKALDEQGADYYSNPVRLEFYGGTITFEGVDKQASNSDVTVFTGLQDFIDPVLDVQLYVQSVEDPRFAINRQIASVSNPGGKFVFRSNELKSCRLYTMYVVGKTATQTITTKKKSIRLPCVNLRAKSETVSTQMCNGSSANTAKIWFAPSAQDNRELKLLTFAPAAEPNNILFNINKPDSIYFAADAAMQDYKYSFDLDTSSYPEGLQQFVVRLINVDDEEIRVNLAVKVDHEPALINISYPAENSRVCGIQREGKDGVLRNVLTLDGLITDVNGLHYVLESANGSDINVGASVVHDSRSRDSFAAANGLSSAVFPTRADFHSSNVVGPLAELFDRNGEQAVRLIAYDEGGFKQCRVRTFYFDGLVKAGGFALDRKLFSPNADGVADVVSAAYVADENVSIDISVYKAKLAANGGFEKTGNVLRQIEKDLPLLTGSGLSVWDGTDANSTVLPDGDYVLSFIATDSCGNKRELDASIAIDNTAPLISIEHPTATSSLAMLVEVLGSVTDKHMQNFTVEYGVEFAPVNWITLATNNAEVKNALLASWNTFSQEGPHALRITATDLVGNQSLKQLPLTLETRVNLITNLESVESLFSPNNDGIKESTAIRVGLDENADINLTISDNLDQIRRVLVADTASNAGDYVFNWDGLDATGLRVNDGVYNINLTAKLTSNLAIKQTESISVVVDATAPSISLSRPAEGFVQGIGGVIGSIQDQHLKSYKVFLNDTATAPLWVLLSQGSYQPIDDVLASLEGLAEGEYAIKVAAVDKGEISAEKLVHFVVDNTAPKLELSQPENQQLVGSASHLLDVIANLDEMYPAKYTLGYGLGVAPETLTSIVAGDGFPLPEPLTLWDVSGLADGDYTLVLKVEDKAGLSAERKVLLSVDNSKPMANITQPQANAYVSSAITIVGQASDEHLLDYTVAIAPGVIGASEQFSPIGSGKQSVIDADLALWDSLPVDGVYTLRLRVKDKLENVTDSFTTVTVDTTPPQQPSGLTAKRGSGENVALNWNSNTESDLSGYAVFRAGLRITPDALSTPSFVDNGVIEGRYIYTVVAIDKAGLLSPQSESAQITIDLSAPMAKLHSPINGAWVSGLLDIKGSAYSADDFKEYRLYIAAKQTPTQRQLLRRSPVSVQVDVLSSWDTTILSDDAEYIIRLEAEDINGNVNSDELHVRIDNNPPAMPNGLLATVSGNDVQLNWEANSETDLLGYLLFRNETLANATGAVVGDLKAYAIVGISYADVGLPDGDYNYTLIAIDRAGNISDASLPAVATIDMRAPHLEFVQPANGDKLETTTYVLASSLDGDIASALFQYRVVGSATWIDIDVLDTVEPFAVDFDPTALALNHGDYELQVIATDQAGLVDPAPASITVSYADLTRPEVVGQVQARVQAGNVHLSWLANIESDLAGYIIKRHNAIGETLLLTAQPILSTGYTDVNLDDAVYSYTIHAVDINGNVGNASIGAEAVVYTPVIQQPYTPTKAALVDIIGHGIGVAKILVEVVRDSGTEILPELDTDLSGGFALNNLVLDSGDNHYKLRLVDALGNESKVASVTVSKGDDPSQPTGLTALASGYDVLLAWNPNPETNIFAYNIFRDGVPVFEPSLVNVGSSLASSNNHIAAKVLDGSDASYWYPQLDASSLYPGQGAWLLMQWPAIQAITDVEINWHSKNHRALDYDVQAWSGSGWVTVASIQDNPDHINKIDLPSAYLTNKLRVVLKKIVQQASYDGAVRIAELKAKYQPLITDVNATDMSVVDGHHSYEVTAINQLGFESIRSLPASVVVGDVVAPEPVVLSASVSGSNVSLSWTESTSTDIAQYDIYRDDVRIASVTDLLNLTHVDKDLKNAEYRYRVTAVDAASNEASSNEVLLKIETTLPAAPTSLNLSVDPTGESLLLGWKAPAGMNSHYSLLRSSVSGGSYQAIATNIYALNYRDTDVVHGSEYFYVVVTVDEIGNNSVWSNEVSGVPWDQIAPNSPSLHVPTTPGKLFVAAEERITIAGLAQSNVNVQLLQDAQLVAEKQSVYKNIEILSATPNEYYQNAMLSPDGRAFVFERHDYPYESHIWLYDFVTQSENLLLSLTYSEALHLNWSANSDKVLFTDIDGSTGNYYIRSYDIGSGKITSVSDPADTNFELALVSPDAGKLAAIGSVVSGGQTQEGLWLLDVTTGAPLELAINTPIDDFNLSSIRWSPDNRYISYTRESGYDEVVLYDAVLSSLVVIETMANPDAPQWSPNSAALLYNKYNQASGNNEVWRYELGSGVSAALISGEFNVETPHWSLLGDVVYFVKDYETLMAYELVTNEQMPLVEKYASIEDLQTNDNGLLMAFVYDSSTSTEMLVRITPPTSTFKFDSVQLNSGDNIFSVKAVDAAGNSSPVSESIIINYQVAGKADLVIGSEGLRILPALPALGQLSKITVTVRNTGATAAAPSQLSLMAIDPASNSVTLLDRVMLNTIDAGASLGVATEWAANTVEGVYSIVAVVDPDNIIAEASEANNFGLLEVLISSEYGIHTELSTNGISFAANQQVDISAMISNSAATFSGKYEVIVEDENDFLVAKLLSSDIHNLAYADGLELQAQWNTGKVMAGTYKASIKVFNLQQQLVSTQSVKFLVRDEYLLQTSLTTDRNVYSSNQRLTAVGTINFTTGNKVISNAVARLRVLNTSQQILTESMQPLGDLFPASEASVQLDWNTAVEAVGDYTAELNVLAANAEQVISYASVAFKIKSDGVLVSGDLSLSSEYIDAGQEQKITYTVNNLGNTAIKNMPLVVSLIDAESNNILSSENMLIDIAVAGLSQGNVIFPTSGLAIKSYTVLLQAEVTSGIGVPMLDRLASKSFSLLDRGAPSISITAPLSGEFVSASTKGRIHAVDTLSVITRVETRVDAGAWSAVPALDLTSNLYKQGFVGLDDGPHVLSARAFDAAGNMSVTPLLPFTVDNKAPIITINGIVDGAWYNTELVPEISFADENLTDVAIFLNSAPYTASTPITDDGIYRLSISAVDAAGNTTRQTVTFYIDTTVPVISIAGVEQGGLINYAVTPVVSIDEANLSISAIQLNGAVFVSGSVVSDEGIYSLTVTAKDLAGNHASLALNFEIDRTAPLLLVTTPSNNSTTSATKINILGRTEANVSVTLKLDNDILAGIKADALGVFSFSDIDLQDGSNHFSLYATDVAGNVGPVVPLTVQRISAELKTEVSIKNRVLVWLPENGGADLAELISLSLADSSGVGYTLVNNEYDFTSQLRSGRFDRLLLARGNNHDDDREDDREDDDREDDDREDDDDCGRDDESLAGAWMSASTAVELKASIAAGMGLIALDVDSCQARLLEDLTGTTIKGRLRNLSSVEFESSPASTAANLRLSGDGVKIRVKQGASVGTLNNRHPALIINQYYMGKIALLAFDPTKIVDQVKAQRVLTDLLAYAKPADSEILQTKGLIEVNWFASKMSPPLSLILRASLTPEMSFISAIDGELTDKYSAEWSRYVYAEETRFSALIRLPAAKGDYSIASQLLNYEAGTERLLLNHNMAISVVKDKLDYTQDLMDALGNLMPINNCADDDDEDDDCQNEAGRIERAKHYIRNAIESELQNKNDADYAINKLLKAYSLLEPLKDSGVLSSIGRLLFIYQAEWHMYASSNGLTPLLTFIHPDTDVRNAKSVSVSWYDEDLDSSAKIALYYARKKNTDAGVLIQDAIPEDAEGQDGDSHTWDTSLLPKGRYYLYAIISDGMNSKVAFMPGVVIIKNDHD